MADSFFGLDTSSSNLNDDEGGGEPEEDEYDALNDETFGQDSDEFDWELQHEQLASRLESSRPGRAALDHSAELEASLSQLVLDETDAPTSRSFGSSVWRHDAPFPAPAPAPTLKNVCTVEELERQMRNKHQPFGAQNYFPPRFPPVILQRPPGLPAPAPLPFPQQTMSQMSQPLNKIIGQTPQMGQSMNQMGQSMNQMGPNVSQMGQSVNQFMQNANQMGNQFQNNQLGQSGMMNVPQNIQVHPMAQNMGQIGQNFAQMGHSVNQMGQSMNQNVNQMGQTMNQMGQNVNLGQSMNQMSQNANLGKSINQMSQNVNLGQSMNQMSQNVNLGQSMNQMGQNVNQMGSSVNQMGHNVNQMGQSMNQMGQNMNQMMPNGNQFNPGLNQFPHGMGPPRMIAPPPGINAPRQNFNSNMGPFNQNFRGPLIANATDQQPMKQPNMLHNQQQPVKPQPNQMGQKPPSLSNQLGQKPANQVNQMLNQQMTQPTNQTNRSNQSPQNKQSNQKLQNQSQSQTRPDPLRTDQKVQKSRVYNNSKNMNAQSVPLGDIASQLTSQNFVQMIQNTPVLQQYIGSFHNASHHPMLNRNGAFNNNNQQFGNNQLFNNQRHNGTYSNNNRHSMNGDDCSVSSDSDEYAGLMTQREKQWLINIQMLQLNTGTPYMHDFYYTVFLERQASKEKEGVKEAHKANQQNHPFYSGGNIPEPHPRERHNSNRHNSTGDDAPRVYVPTQFENSLGKLQCGSVTAPRKIIDVEVVSGEAQPARQSRAPSVASTTNPAEVPRELKRTKQLLLDIEALYLVLLRLEELSDPLAISNALVLKEREEKQKQMEQALLLALDNDCAEDGGNVLLRNIESVQRRARADSPRGDGADKRQVVNLAVNQKPAPVKNLLDEDKDDLVNKMFLGLLHNDRLQQILTVRKGRRLVCRFVRRVGARHSRLRALWARALRGLHAAARRDDGSLGALAPHYRTYLHNTTGWSPILESCSLLGEAMDPARTPYALTSAFTLSCVCALVEKASTLVNTPEATSNERQWSKFLKTLARALKNTSMTIAKPLQPLPESKLAYHMKQLDSRSTIEILQRGKSAEFADLSKAEVTELLIKYLC